MLGSIKISLRVFPRCRTGQLFPKLTLTTKSHHSFNSTISESYYKVTDSDCEESGGLFWTKLIPKGWCVHRRYGAGWHLQTTLYKNRHSHRNATKSYKKPKPQSVTSGVVWSCYPDSDRGPHPYQGCALPAEP